NQQKVVVARCIDAKPKVLLLNEPTHGIDIADKAELFRILSDMLDGGMAVIMASSDMLELLGVCDRVVVLHDQAVAGVLSREQATEGGIGPVLGGGSGAGWA